MATVTPSVLVLDCNGNSSAVIPGFLLARKERVLQVLASHQSDGRWEMRDARRELKANLFGYANHNADRLTQQITQFLCARHGYQPPGVEAQDRALCSPEDPGAAVINNQLDDEHNKNENRNPAHLRPSRHLGISLAPCSISVCRVIC